MSYIYKLYVQIHTCAVRIKSIACILLSRYNEIYNQYVQVQPSLGRVARRTLCWAGTRLNARQSFFSVSQVGTRKVRFSDEVVKLSHIHTRTHAYM